LNIPEVFLEIEPEVSKKFEEFHHLEKAVKVTDFDTNDTVFTGKLMA